MGLVLGISIGLGTRAFVGLGRNVHPAGRPLPEQAPCLRHFMMKNTTIATPTRKIKHRHQPCDQAESDSAAPHKRRAELLHNVCVILSSESRG